MQILNIILLISILLVNLYLIFLKDYFKEKGKNVATKEDIEEITKKIESVKIELGHSQLQKTEFLDQHKLALINFYDDYIHWTEYSLKNISVTISHFNTPEKIRQEIDNLSLQKSKVDKSYWRLCLFEIQDIEFINKINNIYSETNDLHEITFNYFLKMEIIATKVKFNVSVDNIVSERDEYINDFVEKRDIKLKTIIGFPNRLMFLIRGKLILLYK